MLANSAIISAIVAVIISFILNLVQIHFFTKKENKRKDLEYFFQKLEELDVFCFKYWHRGEKEDKFLIATKIKYRTFLFSSLLKSIEKKYRLKNSTPIWNSLDNLLDSATNESFEGIKHQKNPKTYQKITKIINELHRNILAYIW